VSGDVQVPKIGPVRRTYVIAGGVAVAGYVLWRYWQASRASTDTSSADSTDAADSTGSYGIDDGTGSGGYYDPNAGGIAGDTTVGDGVISTDQQWYQAALLALEDAGYDTGAGALALGKYLRSEPLTSSEQDMVKVALAAAGNPPSGARAIVTDTSPTPSGLTAPTNLRSGGTPTSAAIPLAWNSVAGASGYVVYRGSAQVATVSGTSYTVGSLSPSTSYPFTVRATNSGGSLSPASNTYTGKTAAKATAAPPASGSKPPTTTTKPSSSVPAHHTIYITPANRSLSAAVAADNKKTKKNHSWQSVWDFNLQYRSADTVKKLKSRGPDKVYVGSSFWVPNA